MLFDVSGDNNYYKNTNVVLQIEADDGSGAVEQFVFSSTLLVMKPSDNEPVHLGPTEFRLLRFFLARPERVHSRTQLLDQVWGDHVYIEERTVDVHIRRLRVALEPFGQASLIETVRGSGYRLSVPR